MHIHHCVKHARRTIVDLIVANIVIFIKEYVHIEIFLLKQIQKSILTLILTKLLKQIKS